MRAYCIGMLDGVVFRGDVPCRPMEVGPNMTMGRAA
jgi:hypothetical protein